MPAPRISIQPVALAHAAALAAAEEARHVELDARLGEREEVRAQPQSRGRRRTAPGELLERALEVAEREAAVDGEALDLLEHRRVRRVERVAPVDAARADHVDGRRLRSIVAHLHRRGVRAQADARGDPERVRVGLRGMVVGRVERREVVVVELDLGALGDAIADARRRCPRSRAATCDSRCAHAARDDVARQRDVDGVLAQAPLQLRRPRAARAARRAAPRAPAAHAVQRLRRAGRAPRAAATRGRAARPSARSSGRARRRARPRARRPSRRARSARARPAPAARSRPALRSHRSRRDESPAPAVPPCLPPSRRPLRFRPFDGASPGSEGELRRGLHAGALSHGPAPCRGGSPAYSSSSTLGAPV